jgi:hypothetical protein
MVERPDGTGINFALRRRLNSSGLFDRSEEKSRGRGTRQLGRIRHPIYLNAIMHRDVFTIGGLVLKSYCP